MDPRIQELLESSSSRDRAKGVKALAQDASQDSLNHLAVLYKQEDDPEVKELIIKAGRYVKKEMKAAKWRGSEDSAEVAAEKEKNKNPEPVLVEVSESAERRAKGLLDSAMNLHMKGTTEKEEKRARDTVFKAYKLNPNLQYDDYYNGVAGEVLGINAEHVPDYIFSDVADGKSGGKSRAKRKAKNDGSGYEDDVTWETALIDLAIYWVVMAGLLIVGMLVSFQILTTTITTLVEQIESGEFQFEDSEFQFEDYGGFDYSAGLSDIPINTGQLTDFITSAGIIGSILYGVIGSFIYVVSLFIYYVILHFSASVVGGDGTLRGLIHKCTMFITVTSVVYTLASLGYSIYYMNSLFSLNETAMLAAVNSSMVFSLVVFISWIVWTVWFAKLVGENYDFGTGSGCISIIISYIVIGVMACGFSFLLTSIFASMFNNALEMSFESTALLLM
ncbi:MAG: hypothetical protein ACPG7F_04665 [Aggregatilineales bacterium]